MKESEPQNLSPEEKRAQIAEQKIQELARRKEAGELEPYDYEVINIWYLQRMDRSITRKDVGNHAIIISPEEFERLGYIEYIRSSGEIIVIDSDDVDKNHPFIIFPEELGEKQS